jgi:hypothetical protein
MFQVLVAVIAIILAVIGAFVGLWYGGPAFIDNSGKAMYAKLLNNGQQIQAAVQLYSSTEGFFPTGTSQQILNSLVDGKYLTMIPEGNWIIQQDKLVRQLETPDQCSAINIAAGMAVWSLPANLNGCPPCSDTAYDAWPSCSTSTQIRG